MAFPVLLTLSIALNAVLLTLSTAGAAYTYHLYSENRSLRTDNSAFAATLTSFRDDFRAFVAAFQSFREDHRVDLRAIAAALQGSAPAARPGPDILAIQREIMDELAESEALADRNMDRAAERQRARSRSPTPAAGRPQRPGVRLSRSIARRASTVDMSSCRIARRLGGRHATLSPPCERKLTWPSSQTSLRRSVHGRARSRARPRPGRFFAKDARCASAGIACRFLVNPSVVVWEGSRLVLTFVPYSTCTTTRPRRSSRALSSAFPSAAAIFSAGVG